MSKMLIIIGEDVEYDCETDDAPRLAIGTLGEEARERWMCSGCHEIGCLVFVESYREDHSGSTYGFCEECIVDRLTKDRS